MRQLAAHTWLLILVPLVIVIILSHYFGKPLNLLQDTQVDYIGHDTILTMRLTTNGQQRTKTIRYEAQVQQGGKVLLYLQNDSLPMPKIGDILMVNTTVNRAGQFGSFNYDLYLRRQGIVGTCWAHRGNWLIIAHQQDNSIMARAARCQNTLHSLYQQLGIHGQELAVLSALTLGYREDLDKDVQQSFSASGAMHVLSVSGLHTAIVWGIVVWLLTLGGYFRPLWDKTIQRWLVSGTAILLIWIYAFVTGLCPSVMRSALMLSFLSLTTMFQRYTSRWNPLLAAATLILLIDPLSLWSVSFQLSFVAVAGIMSIGSGIRQTILLRNPIAKYILELLIMSFAAQMATMPLTLYYFGQTSNYFALTNLIVVPISGLLLGLGFATLAFSWCFIGEWLADITQWCTQLMLQVVQWVEALPYSTTQMHLNHWGVISLYGALICACLMIRHDKVHWRWIIGVICCLAALLYTQLALGL